MTHLDYIDYRINQYGDPVPDSAAMRKYSHKRYIDVNKDWIPRDRLANESNKPPSSLGTDTSEFKSWFSGSKVVDKKGNPLKVYHGSPYNFTEFADSSLTWFSTSKASVKHYTDGDGYVHSAYLSIKNPIPLSEYETLLRKKFNFNYTDLHAHLLKSGYDGIVDIGPSSTDWVVFSNKQIKKVTLG